MIFFIGYTNLTFYPLDGYLGNLVKISHFIIFVGRDTDTHANTQRATLFLKPAGHSTCYVLSQCGMFYIVEVKVVRSRNNHKNSSKTKNDI